MLNAYHEALEFELPQPGKGCTWKRWMDTALESPDDICIREDGPVIHQQKYLVQGRSIVVLIAEL